MSLPPIFTHIAYGVVLGGPGSWNLVGYSGAEQVRLPWFDETVPGHDFAAGAELQLDAEFGAEHGFTVSTVVDLSPAGWAPQTAAPPVPAGRLAVDEVERVRAGALAPRYALVLLETVVDCDDDPPPSMWITNGSQWDADLDQALNTLGLKVPGMGDWLWFRTM
ncbi:hypothetical protein AB0M46_05665 [Dactylosporangium sp. NPDC051485]|uniref:hypothetical protein n=1 Tax=Dactylosporangium sp. NPDC051485 TaxID=3154846 RepID=UPI0034148A79